MKSIAASTLAFAAALTAALPSVAQQSAARQGNETAMGMAARIGVCDGAGIESARFDETESTLRVICAGEAVGMEGGLGAGGAIVAVLAIVAIVAAASGGGGSSSTPGT